MRNSFPKHNNKKCSTELTQACYSLTSPDNYCLAIQCKKRLR